MKKATKILASLISITAAALLLVACGSKNSSDSSKASSAKSSKVSSSHKPSPKVTTKPVDYQQLIKADQAKVKFAFQADSDEDQTDTVDLQVTNQSAKNVKLDEAKIVWTKVGQEAAPVHADQTKSITVKPHKTRTVTKLFSNFASQNLAGAGAFCYQNADHKLAYSYQAFKDGGVTSANLTDQQLIAMNTASSSASQASSASTSSQATKASSSTQSQAKSQPSQKYTSQQLALLAQIYGQQEPSSVDVAQALDNLQQMAAISYAADSATTGHSSVGTPVSFEQFAVSGANLVITHPAGQGSSAWSGSVDLNSALNQVFTQHAAQAQAALSKLQQE